MKIDIASSVLDLYRRSGEEHRTLIRQANRKGARNVYASLLVIEAALLVVEVFPAARTVQLDERDGQRGLAVWAVLAESERVLWPDGATEFTHRMTRVGRLLNAARAVSEDLTEQVLTYDSPAASPDLIIADVLPARAAAGR